MLGRVHRATKALVCLMAWAGLAGLGEAAANSTEVREREVSLREMVAFGERNAPAVVLAARQRAYAVAERRGAEPWLRDNPRLEVGVGPRFEGGATDLDAFASLEQPIELGGQRGRRLSAAARAAERVTAEIAATRWAVRRDVVIAYRAVVIARERLELARRMVALSEALLTAAERRLAAGDVNAIEVLTARAELSRARHGVLRARAALRAARLELAELAGWPLTAPPRASDVLEPPGPVPSFADVLRSAKGRHPELAAREAAVREARSRVAVADRSAWPSPTLGVEIAREGAPGGAPSTVLLGTVGVPLPLFHQEQHERQTARAAVEVSRAEAASAARALEARLARAHAALASATERIALLTTSGVPPVEEALALSMRGFDAGEVPLVEVVTLRERLLAVRLELLEAYEDHGRALADLEFAAGTDLSRAPAAARPGAPR